MFNLISPTTLLVLHPSYLPLTFTTTPPLQRAAGPLGREARRTGGPRLIAPRGGPVPVRERSGRDDQPRRGRADLDHR
jgi:hypothetical protein